MTDKAYKPVGFKDLARAQLELDRANRKALEQTDLLSHQLENVASHNSELQSATFSKLWLATARDVADLSATSISESATNEADVADKSATSKKVASHRNRDWLATKLNRPTVTESTESFRTSNEFRRRVKEFCAQKGIDKQDFYMMAASHYLEFLASRQSAVVADKSAYNKQELIMWKTTPSLINLYCKYSGKKWTIKDELAAVKFNSTDIKVVELGILQTLGNKNFKATVNSFAYFVPEIEVWIETNLPSESVDAILEMNRRKWEAFNNKK